MKKQKLVVLYGGRSTEHEVSCRSAATVLRHVNFAKYDVFFFGIDKLGVWHWLPHQPIMANVPISLPIKADDLTQTEKILSEIGLFAHRGVQQTPDKPVVFSLIHGNGGEDGKMQGFLELLEVPYVGPDVMGSAMAMDKHVAKILVEKQGVRVGPYLAVRLEEWEAHKTAIKNTITEKLTFPLFIKPARGGSSVGISKVAAITQLDEAMALGFTFDDKLIIETGLSAREIECAALGGYFPSVSSPGEVVPKLDFYTYEAKYLDPEGAVVKVPADDLSEAEIKRLKEMTLTCFNALNLFGMARIDFFVDKKSREIFFNEANTIPGFTSISQYPMLWAAEGVKPPDLIDRLIETAMNRAQRRVGMHVFI